MAAPKDSLGDPPVAISRLGLDIEYGLDTHLELTCEVPRWKSISVPAASHKHGPRMQLDCLLLV